jgi:hypothetical protein
LPRGNAEPGVLRSVSKSFRWDSSKQFQTGLFDMFVQPLKSRFIEYAVAMKELQLPQSNPQVR